MDLREEALVEAAKSDPRRFAELYEAHFERIYAFVARRVRNRAAAEDITADVFRQALAAIGGFEWRGVPFSSWLYRIAANEIADYATRIARERTMTRTGEPDRDELEGVEQRAMLYRLVDALPIDQRRVVTMRFAEGRSIREIAADFGRSEGAIKQLQWRALQTLRARMEESHG